MVQTSRSLSIRTAAYRFCPPCMKCLAMSCRRNQPMATCSSQSVVDQIASLANSCNDWPKRRVMVTSSAIKRIGMQQYHFQAQQHLLSRQALTRPDHSITVARRHAVTGQNKVTCSLHLVDACALTACTYCPCLPGVANSSDT